MDLFLPYQLHNSPALFNEYINALGDAMLVRYVPDQLHILVDYFTTTSASSFSVR